MRFLLELYHKQENNQRYIGSFLKMFHVKQLGSVLLV